MRNYMSRLRHLHVEGGDVLHYIITSSNSSKQPVHYSYITQYELWVTTSEDAYQL